MRESQRNDYQGGAAAPDLEAELEGPDDRVTAAGNGAPGDPPMDAVQAELEQLRSEKAELLDRFQRAQAEFENFRKRLMREKESAREYAAMDTIRLLLPVADDLDRALNAPGLDPEVRKGLELIHGALFEVFTRAGLKPMEDEGRFDPNIHEAVDRGPAETDEDDQKILEVYQRGYRFKDRLLRPAMVKVAVKE
jgi:molecular chaperone GrpE